jgi:hypothetical protein
MATARHPVENLAGDQRGVDLGLRPHRPGEVQGQIHRQSHPVATEAEQQGQARGRARPGVGAGAAAVRGPGHVLARGVAPMLGPSHVPVPALLRPDHGYLRPAHSADPFRCFRPGIGVSARRILCEPVGEFHGGAKGLAFVGGVIGSRRMTLGTGDDCSRPAWYSASVSGRMKPGNDVGMRDSGQIHRRPHRQNSQSLCQSRRC